MRKRLPRLTPQSGTHAYSVEPYILGHYRTDYSVVNCLRSLFQFHNETWNIWTHLLGALFFFWLLFYTWSLMPEITTVYTLNANKFSVETEACLHPSFCEPESLLERFTHAVFRPFCYTIRNILQNNLTRESVFNIPKDRILLSIEKASEKDSLSPREAQSLIQHERSAIVHTLFTPELPKWPIYVYILTAAYTMLASSFLHLFGCSSELLHDVLSKLDHSGISILIAGSFVGALYYQATLGVWRLVYITVILLCSIGAAVLTIVPYFANKRFRVIRTVMFIGMGLLGVFPCAHQAVRFGPFHPVYFVPFLFILLMAFLYILGAVIYATRVPERWSPGRYDLWFSSHQIWHVFVFLAALSHYYAVMGLYTTAHFGW
eukprot:TRINITY_DN2285_c0_g4_i1.p1 TRINITY_DN2285_c0_g4~~TRINITY_DN2285_c0_g4_i1.p1  ORF type:complete len:376 (-),score=48.70 TRINITY_DN2285_c0_g4_i1:123-1250(-)